MNNPFRLNSKILGFWIKTLRDTQNWSQEALAASSNIDVRTIQRIEAGQSSGVTTRRAIARAFGYTNVDIFDSPEFAANVNKLFADLSGTSPEAIKEQFPDHIRFPATRVKTGRALGQLADVSDGLVLQMEDDISLEAKEIAAGVFDYLRDLQDVQDVASFSDKLGYQKELENMLVDLEKQGAIVYSAMRETKLTNKQWSDQTPLPFTGVYITVVPSDRIFQEMLVPKSLR